MTFVYLGLGSNLGDRRANLATALAHLEQAGMYDMRLSPIYETPALMPLAAPVDWNSPYLNLVAVGEFQGTPHELLAITQAIETRMGRRRDAKWAPRILDIDILVFGDVVMATPDLTLPHPELLNRAFVLDPLKDVAPALALSGEAEPMLRKARHHPQHQPALMAIVNITPDSFSDGGSFLQDDALVQYLEQIWPHVAMIDVGAESTRPNAVPQSHEEEWARLEPALQTIQKFLQNKPLPPRISVDTRHGRTAEKALELGVDCINDVGGFGCAVMRPVIASSTCDYVLMHALDIPVEPAHHLPPDQPPVPALMKWFSGKLDDMDRLGIARDRVLLDPGLGFGKTAQQSWDIVRNIKKFWDLECRILVGHSRKSFLSHLFRSSPQDRDCDSIGVSLALAQSGVDVLRVHNPVVHHRALQAFLHANSA